LKAHSFTLRGLPVALTVLVMICGCGKSEKEYPSTPLEGTVSVDGALIAQGTISISPTQSDQGKGTQAPIVDGKYSFEKAPLGKVIVSFEATQETGRTYFSEQAGKELPEIHSLIPSRYELGVPLTITAGMAAQHFALENRQRFDARRARPRP
jgi:hypothetical protein